MYCYCLHTAVSCENILFWTQKSSFCPSSPEIRWWPTDSRWQKEQRSPLPPPCPDVIRPCTGDPAAAEKAQGEGSSWGTQLQGATMRARAVSYHWGDTGTTLLRPLSLPALKPLSRKELSPGERGRAPGTKPGWAVFENASQKQNLCFSFSEGLQGDNTEDGYFCSQKTSKVRVGHMFQQMCSRKTLLRIYTAVKPSTSSVPLTHPKLNTPIHAWEEASFRNFNTYRKWGMGNSLFLLFCFLQSYFFKRNPSQVK